MRFASAVLIVLLPVGGALAGVDSIPAHGFAGSRVVRTGQKILVRDASGKDYLMVRARPFSNTNLIQHVRVVATSDDGAFDLSLPAGAYRVSVEGLEDDPLCSAPYWVLKLGNPHEAPALDRPGVPSGLKLVATWTADDFFGEAASRRFASEAQEKSNRFRAVGRCAFGELDGRRYLESGAEKDNRFALRFKLRKDVPLHCFEFDYPDDKARTGEIIIEPCKKPSDHYEMQCGYICGLEHRLTGRMLTHRTLYWTASDDVVAVFRSLHGQPAAVAGIRVYEVEGAALPVAAVPPAKGRTERRHFAYYSEDMPINFCFSADQSTPASFDRHFNRLAAVMKYVGQDTLAYPAVWYAGVVDGTGGIYNPHGHAKDYLQGIFEKFDREGLSFIPLVHRFAMLDGIPAWDPLWPDKERWTKEEAWERLFPDQFFVEHARGVIWGMQPSVHNFRLNNATEERYAEGYRFMIDTARFYHANREFLFDGEMLNPGELDCEKARVEFLKRGTYTKDGEYKVSGNTLPTVFHSVWRSPSGRVAAILVNWSRQPRRYSLRTPDVAAEGELPPRSWRKILK